MFSSSCGFKESYFTHYFEDGTEVRQLKRVVHVRGVQKLYLAAIIQYLYSDNFIITDANLLFFMNLMIYADYFMLPRLSEICQSHISRFVKPKNCLELYLVARAHNAAQLEQFCLHFIAVNEEQIKESAQWREFSGKAEQALPSIQGNLVSHLLSKLAEENEEDFGDLSV
jgi:hypothetical protein